MGISSRQKRLIESAIAQVAQHGQWVKGPEVYAIEKALAARVGVAHAIGCNSGTDALILALKALGIGPGNKVAVPAFTFQATAAAVVLVGAEPVFADISEDDFGIDVSTIPTKVDAVIGVDMFGIPADWESIKSYCECERVVSVEDAAQAIGASTKLGRCGSLGDIGCTSFFPSKPLSGIGDGGMVFVKKDSHEKRVRTLADHGRETDPFEPVEAGMNSRLDSIQAAVLMERLRQLDGEIASRQAQAKRYYQEIGGVWHDGAAWAWYPKLYGSQSERDRALDTYKRLGVRVIYPAALTQTKAFERYYTKCPVAESVCHRILAFPIKHTWEFE